MWKSFFRLGENDTTARRELAVRPMIFAAIACILDGLFLVHFSYRPA